MMLRAMAAVLVAAFLMFAPGATVAQSRVTQAGPSDQVEANKAVVFRAFRALQDGDLPTLNALYDPTGPIHTSRGTVLQGGPFTELKDSCAMCAALSSRKMSIDLILGEGDLVAVRSTWTGKFSGVIKGTQISGKEVTVTYTNIYRIAHGQIVENWPSEDQLVLAEQLGLKLAPAT